MLYQEKELVSVDAPDGATRILEFARNILNRAHPGQNVTRPQITLSYAQSLDGCVTAESGSQTLISNNACQVFTHRLRAIHDSILVGINTVLIDNPQLNVRLVSGDDPIPIIVDSRLRTPPDAHFLREVRSKPVVFTTKNASPIRAARLRDAGVDVVRVSSDRQGRVDLSESFQYLSDRGIRSVMIEGGARIITSVLSGSFADQLVMTIAPVILGGVQAVESMDDVPHDLRPKLRSVTVEPIAGDLILHGEFERPE